MFKNTGTITPIPIGKDANRGHIVAVEVKKSVKIDKIAPCKVLIMVALHLNMNIQNF